MSSIQKFFSSRNNQEDDSNGNIGTTFVGETGRLWYNPDDNTIYVSDGDTAGGIPVVGAETTYSNSNVASYLLTNTGNIQAGNFIALGDYYYSNGDTILDTVVNYIDTYTGNVSGGNISITNTANLGNFTIWDQTLAGTVTDRTIDISPVGEATVRILNGIGIYQGSFSASPLFGVSNVGVVSTIVPNAISYLGAFEIVGNPSGDTVPPQNYGVMLHTTGAPGTPGRIYNDGASAYGAIINRRYNGTSAAPTGVLANQIIGRIGATPYLLDDEWPSISTSRLDFVSTEDQYTTSQGTQLQMWATEVGTTTPVIVGLFEPGRVLVSGDLMPNSTSSLYSLGNSVNKWGNLYLGPSSLFIEDTTLHTNAELTIDDGALLINGTAKIQIGNMQMTTEGISHIPGKTDQDLEVGTLGATGNTWIRNYGIRFKDDTLQVTAAIPMSYYGNADGVATLGPDGKVTPTQLPAGAVFFKGTWNAATNLTSDGITLANGVGTAGWEYECVVAGTVNFGSGPIAFVPGDFVIYTGTTWERIPGTGGVGVTSFNTRTGDVTLTSNDVTTALNTGSITNTKLANANITVTAGVGLTGGGMVSLGNTITITANVSDVSAGTGVTVSSDLGGNHTVSIGQPVGTANSVQFLAVSATNTIEATGNVTGGNLTSGGQVVVTGNIVSTGGYLKTTGTSINNGITTTGNIYANTGNGGFGNIRVYGNTETGNAAMIVGVSAALPIVAIAQFTGNNDTYTQINVENINSVGSADYVATADIGTDSSYYVDMGIVNSNNDNTSPSFTSLGKLDAYLYAQGNRSIDPGGNLVIGTAVATKVVKIIAGGVNTSNVVASFSSAGFTASNITANTGIFTGNGYGLTNLTGSNVTGQVSNALVAGTVYTAAQPNITSVGTLTALTVSGNISSGNINTTGQLVSTVATGTAPLKVSSNTVVANLNASLLNGYTTATSATASTIVLRDANGNITGNFLYGNGSQITGINAFTNVYANGTAYVSSNAAGVLTVHAGNNQVITGVAATNVLTIAVNDNPTFGNVTILGNIISTGTIYLNNIGNIVFNAITLPNPAVVATMEYDGKVLYFTPQDAERGVIPAEQFFVLNADRALSFPNTTPQSLFGLGPHLSANTRYWFRIKAFVSRSGGTNNTALTIGWQGTAILSRIAYSSTATIGALGAVLVPDCLDNLLITGFTNQVAITGTHSPPDNTSVIIVGIVDVGATGGTLNPYFSWTGVGAPGSVTVAAPSGMDLYPIGVTGANTQVGNWS